jgi:hypothetical protein
LATEYSFYNIIVEGVIYDSNSTTTSLRLPNSTWNSLFTDSVTEPTQFAAAVDTGTKLVLLPSNISDAYAKQFNPEAVFNIFTGEYWALCHSEVPDFGLIIGGKMFMMEKEDLLLQGRQMDWDDNGIMYCCLGVGNGLQGPYILGETFLDRVLTVYDVGASEMRFASRTEKAMNA